MSEVLIIVPVLGRPERAKAVYRSATEATDVPWRMMFLCSPGDLMEQRACSETGAEVELVHWDPDPGGDWARKVNHAYRISEEPWLLLGADDLRFHAGWASEAIRVGEETGAGVVGTNDLSNPRVKAGLHSTHPLVNRRYADIFGTIDGPRQVVSEVYDHQFCDDEIVLTAKRRDRWAFARGSVVEHLHPYFGKAKMDDTYKRAFRATRADQRMFAERRKLIEMEV